MLFRPTHGIPPSFFFVPSSRLSGKKTFRRAFLRGGKGLRSICAVEQRLARQAHNLEVAGSIPAGAIRFQIIKPPDPGGFFLRFVNSRCFLQKSSSHSPFGRARRSATSSP